jgi:hypothetical protein
MIVNALAILTVFFYDCGQNATSTPLTDRVVMGSGGGTKGVGAFGDQLIEAPPGPIAGTFDDHVVYATVHFAFCLGKSSAAATSFLGGMSSAASNTVLSSAASPPTIAPVSAMAGLHCRPRGSARFVGASYANP